MIRKSTNQISIKPVISTNTKIAILVVVVIVFALSLYFSYRAGVASGNNQYQQDSAIISQLNTAADKLKADLDVSQEQLIFAQRQKQIQEEAYKQMSNAYASSEQKNRYLGSRLDFYRSIISPEGGQSGPAIQAIEYRNESNSSGDHVAFDVTLVQAINHKVHVSGNLIVELYQGDEKIEQWPTAGARSINYQYFQQISGVFELVPELDNASVKVILSLHDGTSIERSFPVELVGLVVESEVAI